jgi:excinuclease UvrABC ATPase subunit
MNGNECVWCNGSGVRYVDIGDNNGVEVRCDYCGGTGQDKPLKENHAKG